MQMTRWTFHGRRKILHQGSGQRRGSLTRLRGAFENIPLLPGAFERLSDSLGTVSCLEAVNMSFQRISKVFESCSRHPGFFGTVKVSELLFGAFR